MFTKQYFLEDINTFTVKENSILFKNNNDDLFFNNLKIDKDVRSFFNCNENIIFFKNKFTNVYSLQEKKIIDSINGSLFFDTYNNEDLILVQKIDGKRLISKIDFNCSSFGLIDEIGCFSIEHYFRDTNNNFFFSNNANLQSLSLQSYNLNWETSLDQYGEIRKILGIKENKLWISMYRGGNDKTKNTLIALNIDSGHIVYEKNNDYDTSDWFIELISEHDSILSIYGKISTTPADSPLVEINAITGEIIRNQKIESLYNENLKIGFWKVLKDKIYFTANKDALNGNHIGVLDYDTLQILWVTKIDNMKGTFKDLQITENKIYALDTANQLHIYEKE